MASRARAACEFIAMHFIAFLLLGIPQLLAKNITQITVTPLDSTVSADAIYDVVFTADSTILPDDKLFFQFPSGFDVSGVVVSQAISGIDGAFSISINGQQVVLARDNTGSSVSPGTPVRIRFGTVGNTTTAANGYMLSVAVLNSGNALKDGPNNSSGFNIIADALDHFSITAAGGGNISTQTAGQPFSVRIVAQDRFDNTVTSFSSTVALSDGTGTIAPTTSGALVNGVLTSQSVTITRADSDVTISAAGNGKSGTSNSFAVEPAALDHFSLSTIPSPQKAGVGFSVTITAQDAFDNTVTSFNQSVSVSISAGTVSPTTTGVFSSGVRNEVMSVLTVGSGLTITVDDGASHSGTSNAFNVSPGDLDHFAIMATDSGNIPDQVVGISFNIRIEARDRFNNLVTGFASSVILSDSTRTISPTTSGTFTAGVLASQSVAISKADSSVAITATGNGQSGTSNVFKVRAGPLHHIVLRTAANNGGVIFGDYSMTADDSVTVYAAGYDLGESYLGDVSVTWSSNGGLAPAVSGSGATFTFKPTTASVSGTTGQIIGTHAVGSDATGLITVTPGVPTGSLSLLATPNVLPADGDSTSTITSSVIRDADGNAVGQGREFTVLDPVAGVIPDTQDVNPVRGGIQIATNASSQLSFLLRADTVGGVAQIDVASDEGSAVGSTSIIIGSLKITSINTPATISQGQNGIQVSMAVQNVGTSTISSLSGSLTFTGAGSINRNADYPSVTRLDTVTTIPGGEVRTLVFVVNASASATVETITIDGTVTGLIAGAVTSDTGAETTASWEVQNTASLLLRSVTAPDSVAQGQTGVSVSVDVENRLGATQTAFAVIDSIKLVFRRGGGDVTSQYLFSENGSNPDSIQGGASATFNFTVNIGAAADTGLITVDARVYGRDANSGAVTVDANGAFLPASMTVTPAAALQIVSITPDQPSVTTSMARQWTVKMAVRNNSLSTIQLDLGANQSFIRFFHGSDEITNEYQITQPVGFKLSGNNILGPVATDTLEFVITQTGTTTGTIIISGRVAGTVQGSGLPIQDDTQDGGKGQVEVETPAIFAITGITFSQPTATQNQVKPWDIFVNVENTGGSDVRVVFNADSTRIFLSDSTGYAITRPAGLSGGASGAILPGGATAMLAFRVDTTGSALGVNLVNARVSVFEINSGRALADTTDSNSDGFFIVQTTANLRILETVVDTGSAPRAPFVNRKQAFKLKVRLGNTGQERVDSTSVTLTTDGPSAIGQQIPALVSVPGGGEATIAFPITGADLRGAETFTARINTAVGANTGNQPQELPAVDDTAAIMRQDPASLVLRSVTPSDTVVSANQITPWEIYVAVEDTGEAGLRFQPQPSDIVFKMNGQTRSDFVVQAPTRLKHQPDLTLPGGIGARDTLVYQVTRTGTQGGQAEIIASIQAVDMNDGTQHARTDTGAVQIEINAVVRIFSTVAKANRYSDQMAALVNTNQLYQIKVVVENLGLEPVRDIKIALATTGNAQIASSPDSIDSIGAQSSDSLFFVVTAPGQPDAGGEIFTASIISAIATQSGKPARIRAPADATARVITQQPAALSLAATPNPADGNLSVGQSFTISATVTNAGEAATDNSGEVTLAVPGSYNVQEPLVRSFAVAAPVVWHVTAPLTPSGPDTFDLAITKSPLDLNSNLPANLAQIRDTVFVETDTTNLRVDSLFVTSPTGAMDDTVSTEQFFTVRARIDRSPNLPDVSATLRLAPGFQFRFGNNDSTQSLGKTQSVTNWEIQAPVDATELAQNLVVRVAGLDGQGKLHETFDTLRVVVVLKAQLQVDASIISPAGAESGVLRRGQSFVLRAFLRNVGEAGTVGEAKLRLVPGTSGITVSGFREKTVVVNDFVEWSLKAPDSLVTQKPLIVEISKTPFDENRNQPAVRTKSKAEVKVSTRNIGALQVSQLEITGPAGATDSTVSTGQGFSLGSTVSWRNATNLQAELILPKGQGFVVTPSNSKIISLSDASSSGGSEFLSWNVIAPKTEVAGAGFAVVFSGRDAADTTTFSPRTDTLRLNVVSKASLALSAMLSSPAAATDGTVSTNQIFTIRANLTNTGAAGLLGASTLRLSLPPGGYTTQEPLEKSATGDTIAWQVQAPAQPHDGFRFIEVQVVSSPRDENSEEVVEISPPTVKVGVQTESSALAVLQLPLERLPTVVHGQEDIPVLKVQLENKGAATASNILLRKLKLAVYDRDGNPLSSGDVLAALKIRREGENQIIVQKAGVPGNSEVELDFSQNLVLQPQMPEVFIIDADIAQNPALSSFHVRLESSAGVDAIDQDSRQAVSVEIQDATGTPGAIFSDTIVLLERGLDKSFMNYPNPFGTEDKKTTAFTYFLDQDSPVHLRIYTLFGELVWERQYAATDPQGRADGTPKTIVWGGTNGRGKQVLNGVYLAVLTTRSGTVTTKVAVFR